jgi:2-oxoglutarate ferredoxin oxidoreductase subunit alpha
MTAAIGAAFGGAMAITTSSGPGIALKQEGIGLVAFGPGRRFCID